LARIRRNWMLPVLGLIAVSVFYFAYQTDVRAALSHLRAVGWQVLLLIPIYLLWSAMAAAGWRTLLSGLRDAPPPPVLRLLGIRLGTQVASLGLPVGGLAAGASRTALLAETTGWSTAITSTVLDTITDVASGSIFVLCGCLLYLNRVAASAVVIGVAAVVAVAMAALMLSSRRLGSLAARLTKSGGEWNRLFLSLARVDKGMRLAFLKATGWRLLERLMMALEIAVIAAAIGHPVNLMQAVFMAAHMIGFGLAFFYVPAQAGANETGVALASAALGLPVAVGIEIALVRRARQIVVALAGLPALALSRRRSPSASAHARPEATPPLMLTGNRRSRATKVLIVVPAEGFGGAERQAITAIRRLPDYGIETLAVVGPGRNIVDALERAGVRNYAYTPHFPGQPRPGAGTPRRFVEYSGCLLEASRLTARVAAEHDVSLIYAFRTFGWLVAGLAGHWDNVPVVWRAGSRATDPIELVGAWFAARFFRPSLVVHNSQAVQRSLKLALSAPQVVLTNCVDTDRFHPERTDPAYRRRLGLSDRTPVVGIAARPAPGKGLETVADAMPAILETAPSARLLIAGDHGWTEWYKKLYAARGLDRAATFLGYVRDIEAFYASCDVIVLPSDGHSIEGIPNALLEAMAMERAVVGTRVGGIPEIIRDGVNGRIVNPNSHEQLANVISELLLSRETRRALGLEARRAVLGRHAEHVIMERLAELLREVELDVWSGNGGAAGSSRSGQSSASLHSNEVCEQHSTIEFTAQ